jgi:hypothetical protein
LASRPKHPLILETAKIAEAIRLTNSGGQTTTTRMLPSFSTI